MRVFFAGGEVSDHRRRLLDAGVKHIGLSFWNLKKRASANWRIAEHFPPDVAVFVDSGAYAAASKQEDWSEDDWVAFGEEYVGFVEANLDALAFATEFDAPVLGREYVLDMREDFWNDIDPRQFMPVWHTEHGGIPALEEMAEEFPRIALGAVALDDKRRLATKLNSLVRGHKLWLHGIGITKPDAMLQVHFGSVSSTSWVSPMRYGDTIVWQGNRLRRYPVRYREQAMKRHRGLMVKLGLDPEAIEQGDPNEVTKLSLWSWLQFEEHVTKRHGPHAVEGDDEPEPTPEGDEAEEVAAMWGDAPPAPEEGSEPTEVAISPPPMRHAVALLDENRPVLPVMGFTTQEARDNEGNVVGTKLLLRSSPVSMRRCDSCYLADRCPEFTPGDQCHYQFPVEIRDADQLKASMEVLLETQLQRIAFARLAEETEGGYPDTNVSAEMDRYFRMVLALKEISDNRDVLKMEVKTRGDAGILSRIFGAQNVPPPDNAIVPQRAEEALADILDAEVVEDEE